MFKPDLIFPYYLRTAFFNAPRRIIYGLGSINTLNNELVFEEGNKILLVTDEGVKKAGIVDKITGVLKNMGLIFNVYERVEPDPHIETAIDVAKNAREGEYDAVIGLGGGSPMDTAKVASFSVANPGNVENYLGRGLIKKRGLPLICIPTTSGTGSEITVSAVFSVGSLKRFFASPHIVPDVALIDPDLTVSMPPKVTTGSGLDALSHAVEGIISLFSTPLTQAIGLAAIRLISSNIRKAYHTGRDIEARCNMALAATMAGLSFSDPGVVHGHSIAQTFGPLYNIPHGLSCAMTLPYIMSFYRPVAMDKLCKIAEALGLNVHGLTEAEASEAAIMAVHELNVDLEIPSLKDVGADMKDLTEIAENCVKSWIRPNSPRQLTVKTVRQILEGMWSKEGQLES